MKKLLSLPPNLVDRFHEITGTTADEFFCSCDPVGQKLGSGGGSAWLLQQCHASEKPSADFSEWLTTERRLLLHAGGQSRRLPAYAPSGKVLTPLPVFRWERGQQLTQNLLDLQLPLYEQIMDAAPQTLTTMIVSGDVYIRATQPLQPIPDADVVCFGLQLDAEKASHHGVFVSSQTQPQKLLYMLQKPSVETFNALEAQYRCLVDIGIWLLSDRAVKLLMQRSTHGDTVKFYDLYTDFGQCLGAQPCRDDSELKELKVAVLPLPGGEFYHFGTSREIISSMLRVQNADPKLQKTHRSVFIQNSEVAEKLDSTHTAIWIENSVVGKGWKLGNNHLITGVPENEWQLSLTDGQCVDIVPVGDEEWAVRPYAIDDAFRGRIDDEQTRYMGKPFVQWAQERWIDMNQVAGADDLQAAEIFPVVSTVNDAGLVLRWMMNEPALMGGKLIWKMVRKMSADQLSSEANLQRLVQQRRERLAFNLPFIEKNNAKNMFYELDLQHTARLFAQHNVAVPYALPEDEPLMKKISSAMFRSEVSTLRGKDGTANEQLAFALLRHGLSADALQERQHPRWGVEKGQTVVCKCPVRIDLAGGWTDTPPFSLLEGGSVVNIAINLDGQSPLEARVSPIAEPLIRLKSIDLKAEDTIETYEQLAAFNVVGSPFSIPKAALALAGFLPAFSAEKYDTLQQQLKAFGCGLSITLCSAVPAGSGLGTSSLLASAVLGALNHFCALGWSQTEIGHRTLVLEQLLTTGGGWQDQYGGLLPGAKLLTTEEGFSQTPTLTILPSTVFNHPDMAPCHLLYFTGIQRTAKTILAEIVHRMFLNEHKQLNLLRQMKHHAVDMARAIKAAELDRVGQLVGRTWQQNQMLDSGTNPAAVARLTDMVHDLCLGYKSPGAGGGGFLYMVAKDPEAALRIRKILTENRINSMARFYDMKLSTEGITHTLVHQ